MPLTASAAVLPPDQSYGGRSQYAWSALWWQTFLEAPAANNPLLGSSDSSALKTVNSKDPAVVFLTGSGDGTPIERSLTVTTGQALFFPIVNYSETDPFVAAAFAVCRRQRRLLRAGSPIRQRRLSAPASTALQT
jgi:hypothetical protein